jgi:hypothetical protein
LNDDRHAVLRGQSGWCVGGGWSERLGNDAHPLERRGADEIEDRSAPRTTERFSVALGVGETLAMKRQDRFAVPLAKLGRIQAKEEA